MKLHNKDTGEDGRLMMCHDYDEFPFFIEIGSIKIYYHNFAEMIEAGWDCVKIPAEPLIKDKKIRKAVRAWAEMNDIRFVHMCSRTRRENARIVGQNALGRTFTMEIDNEYEIRVCFKDYKECYTVVELCGEEDE